MSWPTQQGMFELGDFALQKGGVLPDAKLSWKAHGTLSAARDNVILYPSAFTGHHTDMEWLIGPEGILDPGRWFIVITDMLGNGLSTSPSNSDAYPRLLTNVDQVRAQHRLLEQAFGVAKLACVYGFSMGAQQAYHWAALHPQAVERVIINCGSAKTAPHNRVYLAGMRAILEAAPEYAGEGRFRAEPQAALRAMGRVNAGWTLSQEFYRKGLYRDVFGIESLETLLEQIWDVRFTARHASDLYAQLTTWYNSDISDNDLYGGDLTAALKAITARVLLMPSSSDLYFRVADNEGELPHLANAKLVTIPSDWGHQAGNPLRNPVDLAFVREQVRAWLAA